MPATSFVLVAVGVRVLADLLDQAVRALVALALVDAREDVVRLVGAQASIMCRRFWIAAWLCAQIATRWPACSAATIMRAPR